MSNHSHVETHNSSQKTLPAYIIGLILCIILTVLSFGVVADRILDNSMTYIVLSVLAIIQLIVQSVCFLRLNAGPEGRWNLMPFLFSILIIAILVGGSLWIMYNLNYFMSH